MDRNALLKAVDHVCRGIEPVFQGFHFPTVGKTVALHAMLKRCPESAGGVVIAVELAVGVAQLRPHDGQVWFQAQGSFKFR
jgi:hypothetical protein